jgi:CheY-like chemotaxis protein
MEALEELKNNVYDLLFMDIRMPGIDGIKTTQFIRDEMKISESDMPIVFISAAPVNEEWQKYRMAGMNAFLQKPFTEELLLTTILAAMENDPQVTLGYNGDYEIKKQVNEAKIDLQNLYHISGGDQQFVKQMLDSFITTTQKGLKELQDAAFSGQFDSAANLAHKLLSPCRHIGAMDLYKILNKIENDIRTNVISESAEELIAKSSREFMIISRLLKEHISEMD